MTNEQAVEWSKIAKQLLDALEMVRYEYSPDPDTGMYPAMIMQEVLDAFEAVQPKKPKKMDTCQVLEPLNHWAGLVDAINRLDHLTLSLQMRMTRVENAVFPFDERLPGVKTKEEIEHAGEAK